MLTIGVGLMVTGWTFRFGILVSILGVILVLTGLKSNPKREFPKLETGQLQCPTCGMDNNEGSDYCDRCGTALKPR